MSGKSKHEETLAFYLDVLKIPYEREYRFCHRRWRFDFAFPDIQLAVEVMGGVHSGGRHTRGIGYERDCEKLCNAVSRGWSVMYVTPKMIKNGFALEMIEKSINIRCAKTC